MGIKHEYEVWWICKKCGKELRQHANVRHGKDDCRGMILIPPSTKYMD